MRTVCKIHTGNIYITHRASQEHEREITQLLELQPPPPKMLSRYLMLEFRATMKRSVDMQTF